MADTPDGAPISKIDTQEKQASDIPRVRTYAADMKRAIDARGETIASIVNTEQTSSRTENAAAQNCTNAVANNAFTLWCGSAVSSRCCGHGEHLVLNSIR